MLKRRTKKPKAPKRLTYELIRDEPGGVGRQAYQMLRGLVHAFRDDLAEARIALAWCTAWKPDADGRVTIGKCRKASDLDRELMEYDVIILLSKPFWLDLKVTDEQRRALLDHELMHAAVKIGENGEPEEDAKGRTVYRLRKHDIEEFADTPRPAPRASRACRRDGSAVAGAQQQFQFNALSTRADARGEAHGTSST